jgi:hypothetical protein
VQSTGTELSQYCRDIEAYLCRRNGGHLIRIAGPAFDLVRGWVEQGIPFKIACRGIDRRVERGEARGSRSRPLRIEFCEADVLQVFDEWRRATGIAGLRSVAARTNGNVEVVEPATKRAPALPAHIRRVIERIARIPLDVARPPQLQAWLADVASELGAELEPTRSLRGEARQKLTDRLTQLDAEMMRAAHELCEPALAEELRKAAEEELHAYRERMPRAAFEAAKSAASSSLLRERFRLPLIRFDPL